MMAHLYTSYIAFTGALLGAVRREIKRKNQKGDGFMDTLTVAKILKKKTLGEKITMVTAYDYPMACLAERAGVEMILVGDTLGMVVLGYETTVEVTVEEMVHHIKAVSRGAKKPFVVGDLPFLSYHLSMEDALRNAGRFLQEGGAKAVKLEGGREVAPVISRLTAAGIPVVAHIGFTPQSIHNIGGFFFQGKSSQAAMELLEDALALEEAGAFAVVLELVPWEVAEEITKALKIPTIGIGSGPACDGQVQVFHDLFNLYTGFQPRHAKRYCDLGTAVEEGLKEYLREVKEGKFPTEENTRRMDPGELSEFRRLLAEKRSAQKQDNRNN